MAYLDAEGAWVKSIADANVFETSDAAEQRLAEVRKAESTILFNDTADQALESMIRFAPAGLVEAVDS